MPSKATSRLHYLNTKITKYGEMPFDQRESNVFVYVHKHEQRHHVYYQASHAFTFKAASIVWRDDESSRQVELIFDKQSA